MCEIIDLQAAKEDKENNGKKDKAVLPYINFTQDADGVPTGINVDIIKAKVGETYEPLRDFFGKHGSGIFDIVRVTINGKDLDVFIDDEGLLKPNPIFGFEITSDNGHKIPLAGAIVFAGHDNEGNTTTSPLSVYEIFSLLESKRIQAVQLHSRL